MTGVGQQVHQHPHQLRGVDPREQGGRHLGDHVRPVDEIALDCPHRLPRRHPHVGYARGHVFRHGKGREVGAQAVDAVGGKTHRRQRAAGPVQQLSRDGSHVWCHPVDQALAALEIAGVVSGAKKARHDRGVQAPAAGPRSQLHRAWCAVVTNTWRGTSVPAPGR
ncbi:MAG: hypothetical protein FJ100_23775, partial [Deltaproteobacteria bacterium]|nr:hypothetical protein [Deltaproteobacteria bacterium]